MKKIILLTILISKILLSNDCSPYFNPERFYETPEMLKELLDEKFQNGVFYKQDFKEKIVSKNEILKKDSFVKFRDFIYPVKNGLWKYKIVKNRINEINIAIVEIYRFADIDIANTINDDYGNFWEDYIENAYEMQLTPEQTLFRYNNTYFTMAVFIYGVKGDGTPLKGTVVNLWLKDYTKEVNTYIKCMKELNDS